MRFRSWQDDVTNFHDAFAVVVGTTPGIRSADLRVKLIYEEVEETLFAISRGDLPSTVDGIVDAIYVLIGTAVTFGVDLAPIWDAVHTANMAKVGGAIRDDGKVLKPDGWTAPDVAALLRAQGWNDPWLP
jgi:predicted HAD superfamily Cof-like phosphohydrolase